MIDDNGVLTGMSYLAEAALENFAYVSCPGAGAYIYSWKDSSEVSEIKLVIPEGVKAIQSDSYYDYPFRFCSGDNYGPSYITSITLPNSLETISDYAFCKCNNLTSITIPNSVEWIGDYAFCNCYNLETIYCERSQACAQENWNPNWKGNCGAEVMWNYVIPEYTVTFNTVGGTTVDSKTVDENNVISTPTTEKDGYTFAGWYTDDQYTTEFNFNTPITEDITLYAKWVEVGSETVTDTPSNETPVLENYKNNNALMAWIGGGIAAGLGAIAAVAGIVVAKKRK